MENSPIAIAILLSTVGISLYGLYKDPSLIEKWMFRPYYVARERKYLSFITSGFVHADLSHLLFNMFTFFFFALQLESFVGSIKFLLIYLVSLIVSDLPTYFKQRNNPDYAALGASGAISGLLFSSILYFPDSSIMIFPIPVPIPAPIFGLLYLAWCHFAERRANDNINHNAHLWGAIAGVLVTLVMSPYVINRMIEWIG